MAMMPNKATSGKPFFKGQPVRLDEGAPSADPDLPAFIARPPNAPCITAFLC